MKHTIWKHLYQINLLQKYANLKNCIQLQKGVKQFWLLYIMNYTKISTVFKLHLPSFRLCVFNKWSRLHKEV